MPDPGVQFVSGLSNVHALIGQPAELMCKLSSDNCEGAWYRDSKKVRLNYLCHAHPQIYFYLIIS